MKKDTYLSFLLVSVTDPIRVLKYLREEPGVVKGLAGQHDAMLKLCIVFNCKLFIEIK